MTSKYITHISTQILIFKNDKVSHKEYLQETRHQSLSRKYTLIEKSMIEN